MNVDDPIGASEAPERPPVVPAALRRPFTPAHLEPWRGNIVDVTMRDGSHRIGLLQGIERGVATLRGGDEGKDSADFRVADARRVERASTRRPARDVQPSGARPGPP